MKVTRYILASWSVEEEVDEYHEPTAKDVENIKRVFKEATGASQIYNFSVVDDFNAEE